MPGLSGSVADVRDRFVLRPDQIPLVGVVVVHRDGVGRMAVGVGCGVELDLERWLVANRPGDALGVRPGPVAETFVERRPGA